MVTTLARGAFAEHKVLWFSAGVLPGHEGKVTFCLFTFWSLVSVYIFGHPLEIFRKFFRIEKTIFFIWSYNGKDGSFVFLQQPMQGLQLWIWGALYTSGVVSGEGSPARYFMNRKNPAFGWLSSSSPCSFHLSNLWTASGSHVILSSLKPSLDLNSTFLSCLAPQPGMMETLLRYLPPYSSVLLSHHHKASWLCLFSFWNRIYKQSPALKMISVWGGLLGCNYYMSMDGTEVPLFPVIL